MFVFISLISKQDKKDVANEALRKGLLYSVVVVVDDDVVLRILSKVAQFNLSSPLQAKERRGSSVEN